MHFALDEQQTLLRDSVALFVAQGGIGAAHWQQFADMGWLGAGLPESAGGYGGSALDVAIIAEQLGRGLVIEPFVEVAVLAAQALLPMQHEPPAAAALAALIEGRSIVAPALQPQGAELSETRSGLRLSGAQTLVVGGTRADRFVVAATEGGGLSLLLLDAATPGLRRHDYRLIDGSAACDLHFDEMAIDGHQRLGAPGGAGPVIAAAREQAIVAQCAQALGVMDLALSTTRDYLLQRRQFGAAIASFQVLRHRLADMLLAQEQARATLHGALAALSAEDGDARGRAVSIAKVQSGRSGRFVGAQAIQLHGGIGMTDEYLIGHCFKRLMVLDQAQGSAAAHLATLAGRSTP